MPDPKLPRGSVPLAADAIMAAQNAGDDAPERHEARLLATAALTAALPVLGKSVLRDAATRVLLLADLDAGLCCPGCQRKRVLSSYDCDKGTYQCACGREWASSQSARSRREWSIERSLRLLAAGKPLPELPAKEGDGG